jgi:glyoxylase-like metal-dependent hydrolase (beta-lactamase superfamily II)
VGYTPEQVTDILITHIHTDHTGGLMDGTKRVFPNAVVHVERKEVDYWMDPASKQKAPEHQKIYFDQAAAKFKPYLDAGQVKTFEGAVELFPGIRSIPAPGHTPGHSFYSLERNGEKVVFWGDILHVAEVQFPDPTVTIAFDADPRAAAEQRKRAFADAAEKGYLVAPAHISFPGIGHVRRVDVGGEEYRWYPAPYVNDAPYAK